jgi:hypothetical protein
MSYPVMNATLDDVEQELDGAKRKFPPIHSLHEGYAVILEELDEFWEEAKQKTTNKDRLRAELIQVAAMAVRTIEDLTL